MQHTYRHGQICMREVILKEIQDHPWLQGELGPI